MSRERKDLGQSGENEAVRFLRKSRYRILERNYVTPFGEIDIIAKKDGAIVFIEVKSRSSPLFGPPYLKVTKEKMTKLTKTALYYLKERDLTDSYARFDVVAVNFDKEGSEKYELIENAFYIEGGWF